MLTEQQCQQMFRFCYGLTGYEKSAYTLLLHFFLKTPTLKVRPKSKMLTVYERVFEHFINNYQDGKALTAKTLPQSTYITLALRDLFKVYVSDDFAATWQARDLIEKSLLILWASADMDEIQINAILKKDYAQIAAALEQIAAAYSFAPAAAGQVPLIEAVSEYLQELKLPDEKVKRIQDLSKKKMEEQAAVSLKVKLDDRPIIDEDETEQEFNDVKLKPRQTVQVKPVKQRVALEHAVVLSVFEEEALSLPVSEPEQDFSLSLPLNQDKFHNQQKAWSVMSGIIIVTAIIAQKIDIIQLLT